ncbi:MAG: carboxypeptidase regulatory-like domain-containing protein [Archangium sp.]
MLALLLLAGALPAQAQFLSGSGGRLWLSGGGAARLHNQTLNQELEVQLGSTSPTNLHLSAALFPHRFIGIDVEARSEFFYGCCDDRLPKRPSDMKGVVFQPSMEASVSLVGRALPTSWLALEAHLGPEYTLRSYVFPEFPDPMGTNFRTRSLIGPQLSVAVVIAPVRFFQAMIFARGSLLFAPGLADFQGAGALSVGGQLSIGALKLGPLQAGIGPTAEYITGGVVVGARNYSIGDFRFGLGFTLQQWVPDEEKVVVPETPKPLVGRVALQDGSPALDAKVSLDGTRSATTDANGRFTFDLVAAGPHHLDATKEGVTAASAELTMPTTADVVLTLGAPTGPGRITGVVKQPSGVLAGATLTAVEANVTVKSASDGSYALEKVGPGPVTVKVKADEFNDAEEVAQVAPGGVATLDFAMVPKAVAVQATLRGLIRAKNGEAVKATVRVVELKLKLQVKADGRFSADVPSGKYTLIIEARGYVTQTKTVEVSGGDQAIFHTELERSR